MVRGIVLAIASFVFCLTAAADDAELNRIYGRGVHQFYRGNLSEAESLFSEAIGAGTKDPRVYYFRGLIQAKRGGSYAAEADFRMGANLEYSKKARRVDVGRALERVQGSVRKQIEEIRADVRLNGSDLDRPAPIVVPQANPPKTTPGNEVPAPYDLLEQPRAIPATPLTPATPIEPEPAIPSDEAAPTDEASPADSMDDPSDAMAEEPADESSSETEDSESLDSTETVPSDSEELPADEGADGALDANPADSQLEEPLSDEAPSDVFPAADETDGSSTLEEDSSATDTTLEDAPAMEADGDAEETAADAEMAPATEEEPEALSDAADGLEAEGEEMPSSEELPAETPDSTSEPAAMEEGLEADEGADASGDAEGSSTDAQSEDAAAGEMDADDEEEPDLGG